MVILTLESVQYVAKKAKHQIFEWNVTFSYKACFMVLERFLHHAVTCQRKKESIYRMVSQLSILAKFNQSSRKWL